MMHFRYFGRICLMFVLLFVVENYVDDFFHRRMTANNEAIDQQMSSQDDDLPYYMTSKCAVFLVVGMVHTNQ